MWNRNRNRNQGFLTDWNRNRSRNQRFSWNRNRNRNRDFRNRPSLVCMSLNVISDIPAWHKLALYLVAIQWTCVLFQVDLNKVKSSLSDLDISKWHDHTQQMNPAGQVIYHLRKKCHLELSTQAWCKFHEIVASFPLVQLHGPEVNTLHLCEAPGAFISSFNHFLYNSGAILYIFILHCQQH